MSQSPRLDNRFLALRSAAQDATDFSMPDDRVREFMRLRDEGADAAQIASEMGLEREVVDELVRADASQAVAHRIATGEEPMYPMPGPGDQVVDARAGSFGVPVAVLIVVLVGVIAYGVLR
jgi:hypothetical protein